MAPLSIKECPPADLPADRKDSESWCVVNDSIQVLEEDIIQWTNAIFSRSTAIRLQLEQKEYTFNLLPFSPYSSAKDDKPDIVADISVFKKNLRIALQDFSFLDFLRIPAPEQIPPDVICAIFEFHLDALLSKLEQGTGSPIKVDRVQLSPKTPLTYDYRLFFSLAENNTGFKGIGSFLFDRESLAWFARVLSENLPPKAFREYGDLPVYVGFEIGGARLNYGEVKDLANGDIILAEYTYSDPQNNAVTTKVQGESMWACSLEPSSVTVISRVEEKMDGRSEREQAQQIEQKLESLEVDIAFELGRLKMRLDELKSVKEGYVFDLKRQMEKYVTISANGSPIARGELVRIGRRLGVRIIELLWAKG